MDGTTAGTDRANGRNATQDHDPSDQGSRDHGSVNHGSGDHHNRDHGSRHNQDLGAHGEALAAEYLERSGFTILERNWRCRYGELDLVAHHGSTLVAIEVKTRSGHGYGNPLEAITVRKSARLRRLLVEWAREHESRAHGLRVDAVGITLQNGRAPRIDHLQGIL